MTTEQHPKCNLDYYISNFDLNLVLELEFDLFSIYHYSDPQIRSVLSQSCNFLRNSTNI